MFFAARRAAIGPALSRTLRRVISAAAAVGWSSLCSHSSPRAFSRVVGRQAGADVGGPCAFRAPIESSIPDVARCRATACPVRGSRALLVPALPDFWTRRGDWSACPVRGSRALLVPALPDFCGFRATDCGCGGWLAGGDGLRSGRKPPIPPCRGTKPPDSQSRFSTSISLSRSHSAFASGSSLCVSNARAQMQSMQAVAYGSTK